MVYGILNISPPAGLILLQVSANGRTGVLKSPTVFALAGIQRPADGRRSQTLRYDAVARRGRGYAIA